MSEPDIFGLPALLLFFVTLQTGEYCLSAKVVLSFNLVKTLNGFVETFFD